MKRTRIAVLGLLASLAASAADAAVLASAPALAAYPNLQTIYCDIVNLNTSPKDVTIEIVDYSGTVVSTLGPLELLPSTGQALGDGSGSGAWCRFTVEGSARKYRAIAIYDNGTVYTTTVPAY